MFRPRTELQLHKMGDEELVRYVVDAKRAGRQEEAETGMFILLFKHESRMRYRVSLQVPAHLQKHADAVADWVVPRVWDSLLKLPLRGESVGEFVNYYKAAVRGRVIDFFKTTEGKTLERQEQLPSEHQGEPGTRADALGEDFDVDAVIAQIDLEEIVDAALGQMDNSEHIAIIRRAFWDDQASNAVAEEFGTSAMNVDQIKSRFRKLLREECERRGVTGT
jgi:DNA-directed RNA polymerase specialized sigma24 family protein